MYCFIVVRASAFGQWANQLVRQYAWLCFLTPALYLSLSLCFLHDVLVLPTYIIIQQLPQPVALQHRAQSTADSVAQITQSALFFSFCYLCAWQLQLQSNRCCPAFGLPACLPAAGMVWYGGMPCATSCSGKRFLSGQKLNRFRKVVCCGGFRSATETGWKRF